MTQGECGEEMWSQGCVCLPLDRRKVRGWAMSEEGAEDTLLSVPSCARSSVRWRDSKIRIDWALAISVRLETRLFCHLHSETLNKLPTFLTCKMEIPVLFIVKVRNSAFGVPR